MRTKNKCTDCRRVMILLLPLMLAVSGCSLSPDQTSVQLLDLGPSADFASTNNQPLPPPRGEPVAIGFSGAQALTDTNVIWRVGDGTIAHAYATYHWAVPPLQLVEQRVSERLSATHAVVRDGAAPFAAVLQVSLMRFEQVYAPDGRSSVGRVSMRAVLVRDHRVTGSIVLSKSAPAPTQDALGGVTALRTATDAATAELSTWLARNLASSASAER